MTTARGFDDTRPLATLRPEIFSRTTGIVAAMSTRQGGVSAEPFGMNLSFSVGDDEESVRENRRRFFSSLRIPVEAVALPRQVHSDVVARVDSPGPVAATDALVTDTPGLFLCVTIADCVPILLHDPVHRAVATVHAGWRGSAAGILPKALKFMEGEYGSRPHTIQAFVGPAAGGCCYEVGPEVANRFPAEFVLDGPGGRRLDLKGFNARLLLEAGFEPANIEVSPLCTITESELLHSYRRDGPSSGRMMAVIGIRSPGA
jgi:YfiH family protein